MKISAFPPIYCLKAHLEKILHFVVFTVLNNHRQMRLYRKDFFFFPYFCQSRPFCIPKEGHILWYVCCDQLKDHFHGQPLLQEYRRCQFRNQFSNSPVSNLQNLLIVFGRLRVTCQICFLYIGTDKSLSMAFVSRIVRSITSFVGTQEMLTTLSFATMSATFPINVQEYPWFVRIVGACTFWSTPYPKCLLH